MSTATLVTTLAVGATLGALGTSMFRYTDGAELQRAASSSSTECELEAQLLSDRLRLEAELQARSSAPATCPEASVPDGMQRRATRRLALGQPGPGLSPSQRQIVLRHRYGAVIRELALDTGQTERLLRALSDVDARDDTAVHAGEQAVLAQAIGEDKAQQFQALKQTLPARSELRRLRDQLDDAGEPISDEQQRALLAVLAEQTSGPPPERVPGESLEQRADRFRAWVSARDQSFRDNASEILTPSQLRTLDEAAELRSARQPQLSALGLGGLARAGSGG